jgi:2-polyprenyl-3-methyl-5-hydroxy-6-metoxy-1,4-benzoquinol methylase
VKFTAIKTIYASYVFASSTDRIRPVVRYALASFSGLMKLIPREGKLLDVGCGDGLLALLLRTVDGRTQPIVGVDIDSRKIRVAKNLKLQDVIFLHEDVAELPSNAFDVVTVVHVLYLIPVALREGFLRECFRVLKPGGALILAVNMTTPKWKYYFSYSQEVIMVKWLGATKGAIIRFSSYEEVSKWVTSSGGVISTFTAQDQYRPYSHAVVVGGKNPCTISPPAVT